MEKIFPAKVGDGAKKVGNPWTIWKAMISSVGVSTVADATITWK